jgi:hypothetical protein
MLDCYKEFVSRIKPYIFFNIEKTAFQILSSKKVFLYKENIQTCYDIAYNCYQIPIFCIN